MFHLGLSIKSLSHMFVSLDEAFELFLEAVVLVIQISHVFIKGIDFRLQIDLISHHLFRVLLKSVDFIGYRFFILLKFIVLHFQFGRSQLIVFALNILVFICFEKLWLGVLMLLVLGFEVA